MNYRLLNFGKILFTQVETSIKNPLAEFDLLISFWVASIQTLILTVFISV